MSFSLVPLSFSIIFLSRFFLYQSLFIVFLLSPSLKHTVTMKEELGERTAQEIDGRASSPLTPTIAFAGVTIPNSKFGLFLTVSMILIGSGGKVERRGEEGESKGPSRRSITKLESPARAIDHKQLAIRIDCHYLQ